MPKPGKDAMRKENTEQFLPLNIDAEIFNKLLGNQTEHYIKRITNMIIQGVQIIHVMHHINKMKEKNHMIISVNAENLKKFNFSW